ncbi:MAG: sigma-70 family RNA polymerase sigma factor [Pseudomonadota bacterium]
MSNSDFDDAEKTGVSRVFRVFRNNENAIKKFLWRYVSSRHEVEDITQETILRALQAEKSREIREPRAFLFGVAKNIVRKELYKKSKNLIDFIEDFDNEQHFSYEVDAEGAVDTRRQLILFWEAVATLPPQCQRVFVLKKVYGYSHKEIARRLNISVSTVEKHAAAGLRRCSDHMTKKTAQDDASAATARSLHAKHISGE